VDISTETACIDNAIFLDHVTCEVAQDEPDIRSRDRKMPIVNNWTDDILHIEMPGGCKDYDDEGDDMIMSDAVPTACMRGCAVTELERVDMGTSNVYWYDGDDGDDADPDVEEESSQADDGLTQTLEH
jgi:hypothetical protein